MSSRKILTLSIILPTLAAVVYSVKYSGKPCGGEKANLKEFKCPRYYECVLESNKPNAMGVCKFMPNGLRLGLQKPKAKEVTVEPPPKDPRVEYDAQTKKAQRLAYSQNKFGFELLKIIAYSDGSNSQNIVISPTSLNMALSFLYSGSAGLTKEQLGDVLQIKSFSIFSLNESSQILNLRIASKDTSITNVISSAFWTKKGIEIKPDFIQTAQNNYNLHISNLDFEDNNFLQILNSWLTNKTSNKINGLKQNYLTNPTNSYLLSVGVFDSSWKYKLGKQEVLLKEFYKQNGSSVQTTFTKTEGDKLAYLENDILQALKIPYGQQNKYSLIFLLPKDLPLNDFLSKISMDNWTKWLNEFKETNLIAYLPKIKIEFEQPINDYLKEMGAVLPLSEGADFSQMIESSENKLYIDKVVHKTYINIEKGENNINKDISENEESPTNTYGAEKTLATLDLNKPFIFVVMENETQANLFLGIVRELNLM